MINLRFHIVSIVAVFLALAIGILTGSTLLDRATVEVLQGRQRSLDSRNGRLKDENDALRSLIESRNDAQDSFGSDVIADAVEGMLTGETVLMLAMRGIDEDVVRDAQDTVVSAGGESLGIIWFDESFDLADESRVASIAEALGVASPAGASRQGVIRRLAAELNRSRVPDPAATDPADPNQTVPDPAAPGTSAVDPGGEPSAPATPGTDPDAESPAGLAALDRGGFVTWESATRGDGAVALPDSGLRIVLMTGQGAQLDTGDLIEPLARSLGAARAGVIVTGQLEPRRDLDRLSSDDPERGQELAALRADEEQSSRLITVDNLDEPFGRVALTMAVSDRFEEGSGAFGVASNAERIFPTDG